MMFAIVGVSLFAYEITKVIAGDKEFWNAVVIIPILSMSIFFVNMKEVTVYGLHIAKKTRIIGIIVFCATIISFGLNMLLIPVWGITGSAIATLLSHSSIGLHAITFHRKYSTSPMKSEK